MAIKTTNRQLMLVMPTVIQLAAVTSDDCDANKRLGKFKRQAEKAKEEFETEIHKVRVKLGEEVPGEDGRPGVRVKEENLARFNRAVELFLDAPVKLSGKAFTAAEMHEHFKPSPEQIAALLGLLIEDDDAEAYEGPDYSAIVADLEMEGEASHLNGSLRPALVVEG